MFMAFFFNLGKHCQILIFKEGSNVFQVFKMQLELEKAVEDDSLKIAFKTFFAF